MKKISRERTQREKLRIKNKPASPPGKAPHWWETAPKTSVLSEKNFCQYILANGQKCKRLAEDGGKFCSRHVKGL